VPAPTAELIMGLASALRQLTEQRDAVVAENHMHKAAWLKEGYLMFDAGTPSTDIVLDSLRAEGVEMFAKALRVPGDDPFMDAIAVGVAGTADNFARQLRESKGAQS